MDSRCVLHRSRARDNRAVCPVSDGGASDAARRMVGSGLARQRHRSRRIPLVLPRIPGVGWHARHLLHEAAEISPRRRTGRLVQTGLYRVSRNPMYVSVLLAIFGQAIRFGSRQVAVYGLLVWLGFHIVVVLLEEPHLSEERGPSYDEYRRRVPRWLWIG